MEKAKLLIIGGGIAGITSALEGISSGYRVYLVEKTAALGGKAIDYCCKATDKCNKCSVCLAPQALNQLKNNQNLTVMLQSQVIKLETVTEENSVRAPHSSATAKETYKVTIESTKENKYFELEINAIIVAIGFTPFDAKIRGEYGYGRNQKVITGLDLEKSISHRGSFSAAYGPLKNIGFIQCVGSRDLQVDNGYCSQVCCMYSAKLSKLIRSELKDATITIFYMDLQTFGRSYDDFIRSCIEEAKIKFIRGIPAKVYTHPPDRMMVRYANTLTGEVYEESFDLIILSAALSPAYDSRGLAKALELDLDQWGFFASTSITGIDTLRPGIFLAGTCQSPKDIPQSIIQAKAAVSRADSYIRT